MKDIDELTDVNVINENENESEGSEYEVVYNSDYTMSKNDNKLWEKYVYEEVEAVG